MRRGGSEQRRRPHVAFAGVPDRDTDAPRPRVGFEEADTTLTDALGRPVEASDASGKTVLPELRVKFGLVKVGFRYAACIQRPALDDSIQNAHGSVERVRVDDPLEADVRVRVISTETIEEEKAAAENDEDEEEEEAAVANADDDESLPPNFSRKKHYTPEGMVEVTLAARRAGKVHARFTLEVSVRMPRPRAARSKKRRAGEQQAASAVAVGDESEEICLFVIPVVVVATVMGRDQGTPQLRETVHCVGRLVDADDSDADTAFVPFEYYHQE